MALPFTHWGSLSRSAGLVAALGKQAKLINYGAAKRVTFSFDPFGETEPVFNTRRALQFMNSHKQLATNPHCHVKANVLCDRSHPSVLIELTEGGSVLLETTHLSILEILQQFNLHVTKRAPQKPESTGPVVQTKAEKAAAAAKYKKKK